MSEILALLDRMKRAATVLNARDDADLIGGKPPTFGPGCSEGELDELQDFGRKPFPDDYIQFLAACRRIDAASVFNGYFLYSPLRLVVHEDGDPRILHVALGGTLTEVHVAIIGGTGGGDRFLLGRTGQGSGMVWRWDHSSAVRFDGVASEGFKLVASTFTEFLARVADDFEHWAADDRTWTYPSR